MVFNEVLSISRRRARDSAWCSGPAETLPRIADADQLQETLKTLAERELVAYRTSLSLLSDLNQAYGLLREALAVDRAEMLEYVQSRFRI